jgi:spermidine synthase
VVDSGQQVHGAFAAGDNAEASAERAHYLFWDGDGISVDAVVGIPTTAVDLIPSVPKLYPYFNEHAAELTSSPLARIVVDDGRRFLDGSSQQYDAIVIDPPPPPQAPGTSLLYSSEFYEVIKRHLRSGGILEEWFIDDRSDPTMKGTAAETLTHAFRYVRAFRSYNQGGTGINFLASMDPLPVTSSAVLAARMSAAAQADYVEWGRRRTCSSNSM